MITKIVFGFALQGERVKSKTFRENNRLTIQITTLLQKTIRRRIDQNLTNLNYYEK